MRAGAFRALSAMVPSLNDEGWEGPDRVHRCVVIPNRARLIQKICEVDALPCPKCQERRFDKIDVGWFYGM